MAFQPGHKKVGGRRKGQLNRKSLPVHQKAQELGIDPFEILLHFAAGNWKALGYPSQKRTVVTRNGSFQVDVIEPDHRLKAASESCQYLFPKRKAIEFQETKKKKRPLRELTNEQLTALKKGESSHD